MFGRLAIPIGRALLFWAATMVVLVLSDAIAGHHKNAMTVTGAISAPATYGLTLLFLRSQRKNPKDFGLVLSRGTGLRFCIGLALGAILIAIQTGAMWFLGGITWVAAKPNPGMLLSALGYLLLATREELAFRGYPLRLLASRTNQWSALFIVSCMFVVEHKLGGATWPDALVGSGLGALVFGMAALATRGLALPIGLHAAWNIGDWLRGGKGTGGAWRMVFDQSSTTRADQIAWISYAAVMLCMFVVLLLWQRAQRSVSSD